jgi:hypothetical protein
MAITIIKGKPNKKVKVRQGVVLYIKPDNTIQAELVLNEKVIDTTNFSAIIIISEVNDGDSDN